MTCLYTSFAIVLLIPLFSYIISSPYFDNKRSVDSSQDNLISSDALVQSSCPHLHRRSETDHSIASKRRDSSEHHTSSPELSLNRDSPSHNMVDVKSASSSPRTDPFFDNSNGTVSIDTSAELLKTNGKDCNYQTSPPTHLYYLLQSL